MTQLRASPDGVRPFMRVEAAIDVRQYLCGSTTVNDQTKNLALIGDTVDTGALSAWSTARN